MIRIPKQIVVVVGLSIIALVFSLDLFLHEGEAATFDSQIHITNMAMFSRALREGDFPVTWSDGFANYGLPMPLVSQQVTSYLGALFVFITQSPDLAYKLVMLIATGVGAISIYFFLNLYSSKISSLAGATLYTFSAYRIIDAYIRGALPELFAAGLIPLVLIAIHRLFHQQKHAVILLVTSLAVLIGSHPFVFVISLFIVIPYVFYNLLTIKKVSRNIWLKGIGSFVLALGINSWYLFPLVLEMKYFVISKNDSQLVPNQFLTIGDYFSESWDYFYQNDVFVRGNIIQFGIIETLILIGAIIALFVSRRRQANKKDLVYFITIAAAILIFMTCTLSLPFYQHLPFLDGIQFPWRMLSALIILPPMALSLIIDSFPNKRMIAFITIMLILVIRLPQVYGKNYTVYSPEHYYRTIKNLHFDTLNTIWTGNTLTYPVKTTKGEIIEGDGEIVERVERNSSRTYKIVAITPVRLADYTFYFPGWKVFVDGQETPIEFQDVNYRGVITYKVPSGEHQVSVRFVPTKVRAAGQIASLLSLGSLVGFWVSDRVRLCRKARNDASIR